MPPVVAMTYTSLFSACATLASPIAEPIQSKSAILCPAMMTLEDLSIRSFRACAMTLTRTRLLFSAASEEPPKYFTSSPAFCMATWSPPRVSARSSRFCAISSSSLKSVVPCARAREREMDTSIRDAALLTFASTENLSAISSLSSFSLHRSR